MQTDFDVNQWVVIADYVQRDEMDFTTLSDVDLRAALKVMLKHEFESSGTYVAVQEIINEVQHRAALGRYVLLDDINEPVETTYEVPEIFFWWPFSMFWKQKPRR